MSCDVINHNPNPPSPQHTHIYIYLLTFEAAMMALNPSGQQQNMHDRIAGSM